MFHDPYRPHASRVDVVLVPANATDVVVWIGDDEHRAQAALDVERQRTTPRTTVMTAIGKVAPHLLTT